MKAEHVKISIEAANEGGFVVWSARNDYGERIGMLFAGSLDECLNFTRTKMTPVETPPAKTCESCGAIKKGGDAG